MRYFFILCLFLAPMSLLAQTPIKKDLKYGLVKKDAHGYYNLKDTILPTLETYYGSYDESYTKTVYTLNDCKNFNIIFNQNGSILYNNVKIGNYKITNDSLYLDNVKRKLRKRITHIKPKYSYSLKEDTLVLTTESFSLFYLPCDKLKGKVYHDRGWNTNFYNWGIVGGVNYQSQSLFYELGVAKSELSDSIFYSADFSLSYNPVAGIWGANVTAYFNSSNPTIKWPLSFLVPGINFNTYTNFDKVNYGLKPMLGLQILRHKLKGLYFFYGYNIFLNKKRIPELSHHVLQLKLNLPIFIHREKHISHQIYYFEEGGGYGIRDTDL